MHSDKERSKRLEDAARALKNAQEDAARALKNLEYTSDYETISTPKLEPTKQIEKLNGKTLLKKEKLYTVGEMASILAHDLQNPLTIIKNTIDILKLQQPDLDQKTKENYDRIDRAVVRMSQLIHDILDYVRTSTPLKENFSLNDLLKNAISDLKVADNIKIILPTEDIQIFGDIKQLEVVFSNLILNAIQAIEDRGRIMIQASETDDEVVIDVIDNGHGIESQYLPRIFDPLFTTKQSGTGLGLTSCKSIIENHGGTIECSSMVGKGTVFTVHLPKS